MSNAPARRASGLDTLPELLAAVVKPAALIEGAVIVAALALAFAIVHLLRRRVRAAPARAAGSILLGERGFDGVLFPLLALGFVAAARYGVQGLLPAALLRIAVPVLLSLAAIRLTVRVLHRAFPRSAAMRVVERSVSWLAWLAVVLWIVGALPLLLEEMEQLRWKFGNGHVSLRSLLEGAITAVVVFVVALWVSAALEARLIAGELGNLSTRKMAANALRALLLFVAVVVALQAAGIDLTALGVIGGAIGVGIGLGLQKLAANYVSGFVILAERSVRIGDVVKVDTFEGRITDITSRYTVIRSATGREAIVPNETMITQRVENLSLADRNVLLSTTVQVAYGSDLHALMPRLAAAAASVPRVLAEPAPAVQLNAFADSGLELSVLFWIGDPEAGTGNVRSDVNLALLDAITAAGVEIPYPHRVLHRAPRPAG